MIVPVNYWAVLVATVVSFVIGWFWYGPLFGKIWMKARGLDPAVMGSMGMPWMMMLGEFVATLIAALVLAEFVAWLGITTLHYGLLLGVWIWVGFYATTLAGPVLWEKVPKKVYLINAGRWLVSLLAMAAILGVWR